MTNESVGGGLKLERLGVVCGGRGGGSVITCTHFTLVGWFNHKINENRMTNRLI